MARRFYTLDVFTTVAMKGNPLAVVLDSQGLDTARMQAIASEFNLSETVFVSAPRDAINTAAMRIFTPGKELPFAGHPTVGTAILLATLQAPDAMKGAGGIVISLEQAIGLVKVEVSARPGIGPRAVFEIPRQSERLSAKFDKKLVAKALNIDAAHIGFGAHELSLWSAGVPFIMVPLQTLDSIRPASIADRGIWREAFAHSGTEAVFVYTEKTENPDHHVHARMFAPDMGLGEDPATGAAAAAFSGVAVAFEKPKDGTHQLVIEQGYEMGRPSEIALDIDVVAGHAVCVRIGGSAVIVSEGNLHL